MAGLRGRRKALIGIVAAASAGLLSSSVSAVTLTDLSAEQFASTYGEYAPNGDCSRGAMVSLYRSGLTFHVGGVDRHEAAFEYATTFFGPDYEGIAFVLFPFPISADEPGHVLMYVNAEEVPGQLMFEENLGPGESFTPFEAELVRSSPLMLCKSD
ncbi:hypothetical protein GRI89_17720 [Altererythrobacter salegens]|uniref:Uncharacterized protein n=1 Tax=Croceibacterium salegens TaxID=1737568 RepID=A0A6I4SZB5_9SPHN|nr:hypothetical protein [Croceibacterium salegens]MXO61384.1 hypothetical protein [Croceibacterium salegens]